MRRQSLPVAKRQSDFVAFAGGYDTETPLSLVPPGFLRESVNVEEDVLGGYASITGYERYDGKASPSLAEYHVLPFTTLGTVAVGNTITGATSGATAVVIAITPTQLIITKQTGAFVSESIVTYGTIVTGPATGVILDAETDAQYKNLAADVYRALINSVGGGACSGAVLGVWYYKGDVYAFRNKIAGGVGMFKATSLGWQSVNLGYEIGFANANVSVNEGDTLTAGSVTATINRVVVETGTLLSGINTGRLIISAPSGGSFSAGAATTTGGGSLTLSGPESAITIPNQSGRFRFVNGNFYGRLSSERMYGCDGANRPFEFDGSVFVPLNLDAGVYPSLVAIHQKHLFFGYLSSIIHSAIGDPYNYTTTAGGGEIAFSDNLTGLMSQPGSDVTPAISVYARNKTFVVYGTDAFTWSSVTYNENAGAILDTVQKVDKTYVFDDRGITTLETTMAFGNFIEATVSKRVKSWLASKRSQVTDSHVYRDKNQYRLFFRDGTAAYCTITKNGLSIMPVQFVSPVRCSVSEETYGGGDEVAFFGSDDGYVYQMEKGTSFDGDPIEWNMTLVFNHSQSYRVLKKYRRLTFELTGERYAKFYSTYSLSYGKNEAATPDSVENSVLFDISYWDSFTWDEFVWDGVALQQSSMSLEGDGDNISIQFNSNSDYYGKLKFNGVFIEYSPLRYMR